MQFAYNEKQVWTNWISELNIHNKSIILIKKFLTIILTPGISLGVISGNN